MAKHIKVCVTGDSLISMGQAVYDEPRFLDMVETIRNNDVSFTNLETTVHDFEAYPAAQSGGTWTRADPSLIDDLQWMGFNIVSTANNHSLDYMYEGLLSTREYLDMSGLAHAGTGEDLAEARAPAFLETKAGRVALIAASSSFAPFGAAGYARRDLQGRPGLNPLRFDTQYAVKKEQLESLRQIAQSLGFQPSAQQEAEFNFLRNKFIASDALAVHTEPHKGDMHGNLESIRFASRQADWVIFSLHAHESRVENADRPAEFIETFAHACIDTGAHAFIGHGPHVLRGIEIYKGRPIFYSLGNFIFQNDTILRMPSDFYEQYGLDPYSGTPADAFDAREKGVTRPGFPPGKWFTQEKKYWVSIAAKMQFDSDKLSDLRLYPLVLGQEKPRSQRGRPMLAEGDEASEILERVKTLSQPYGTTIQVEEEVGIVKI